MNKSCTVYKTASFIGKRWTLIILHELYKGRGKRRYSDLKKRLPGITPKILSARLKELGREALVKKSIDTSAVPVKCEYSLTPCGLEFTRIVRDMKTWALRWKIKNRECEKTDCLNCWR